MESIAKLSTQIAQQARIERGAAQVVAYLFDLSADGRTLDDAARLMRQHRGQVRVVARRYAIPFPDYAPRFPERLFWRDTGGGGDAVAELYRQGQLIAHVTGEPGRFTAQGVGGGEAASLSATARTSLIAARDLSVMIEHRSLDLLGIDDIEIFWPGEKLLAPVSLAAPPPRDLLLGVRADA